MRAFRGCRDVLSLLEFFTKCQPLQDPVAFQALLESQDSDTNEHRAHHDTTLSYCHLDRTSRDSVIVVEGCGLENLICPAQNQQFPQNDAFWPLELNLPVAFGPNESSYSCTRESPPHERRVKYQTILPCCGWKQHSQDSRKY